MKSILQLSYKHNKWDVRIWERWGQSFLSKNWRVVHIGKRITPSFRKQLFKEIVRSKHEVIQIHDPEILLIYAPVLIFSGSLILYDVHEDYRSRIASKLNPVFAYLFYLIEKILICCVVDVVTSATPAISNAYSGSYIVRNCSPTEPINNVKNTLISSELLFVGGISRLRGLNKLVQLYESGRDLEVYGVDMDGLAHLLGNSYRGILSFEKVNRRMANSKFGLILFEDINYYNDSLPLKFFEYVNAGLPIIAHNGTYVGDLVLENNLGITLNFDEFTIPDYTDLEYQNYRLNCYEYALNNRWLDEFNTFYYEALPGSLWD